MGDEKKFFELLDSIQSIAILGYNKDRDVIYWNRVCEHLYGYTFSEAFGQKIEALIVPKAIQQEYISYINDWYKNGNTIPAREIILQHKDQKNVNVFSSHVMLGEGSEQPEIFNIDIDLSEIANLRIKNQVLEKKVHLDKLTNIFNRHYFESIIDNKLDYMRKYSIFLSLIMFDIDFFKKINDSYGHDVGDKSLITLIKIIKKIIRSNDVLVRWGGDEFMLLVDTDLSQALNLANTLKKAIDSKTSEIEDIPHFTCSFGVVDILCFHNFQTAYKSVDKKLYLAKSNGRNRVEG